jgi:hypothetical protein
MATTSENPNPIRQVKTIRKKKYYAGPGEQSCAYWVPSSGSRVCNRLPHPLSRKGYCDNHAQGHEPGFTKRKDAERNKNKQRCAREKRFRCFQGKKAAEVQDRVCDQERRIQEDIDEQYEDEEEEIRRSIIECEGRDLEEDQVEEPGVEIDIESESDSRSESEDEQILVDSRKHKQRPKPSSGFWGLLGY